MPKDDEIPAHVAQEIEKRSLSAAESIVKTYTVILKGMQYDVKPAEIGPLERLALPFKLRAYGVTEVRILGKVTAVLKKLPEGSLEPKLLGEVLIHVGPEAATPPHTVPDLGILDEHGQYYVDKEKFASAFLSAISKLTAQKG